MKNLVTAIALLTLLTASASAQERRLSEVAGDIRLHSPEGETFLVDLAPAPAPGSAPSTDGAYFVDLSDLLVEHVATVEDLLDDVRFLGAFYDNVWRQNMTTACADLGTVSRSLLATSPPSRYSETHATLVDAALESIGATDAIERSIETDRPVYGPAFDKIVAARRLAAVGAGDARRLLDIEVDEGSWPPEDAATVRENIVSGCDRAAAAGRAYNDCVATQQDAYSSLSLRFSSTVLLDDVQFNTIRNQCRREWRSDYVERDRCERRRFAEREP